MPPQHVPDSTETPSRAQVIADHAATRHGSKAGHPLWLAAVVKGLQEGIDPHWFEAHAESGALGSGRPYTWLDEARQAWRSSAACKDVADERDRKRNQRSCTTWTERALEHEAQIERATDDAARARYRQLADGAWDQADGFADRAGIPRPQRRTHPSQRASA